MGKIFVVLTILYSMAIAYDSCAVSGTTWGLREFSIGPLWNSGLLVSDGDEKVIVGKVDQADIFYLRDTLSKKVSCDTSMRIGIKNGLLFIECGKETYMAYLQKIRW
jgi:hypothetical protein